MVGVNIGDTLTPTPWTPEKIEQVLSEARCSGYFACDAVKFWHCDAGRILPTAQHDHIRKVCQQRRLPKVHSWVRVIVEHKKDYNRRTLHPNKQEMCACPHSSTCTGYATIIRGVQPRCWGYLASCSTLRRIMCFAFPVCPSVGPCVLELLLRWAACWGPPHTHCCDAVRGARTFLSTCHVEYEMHASRLDVSISRRMFASR